MPVNNKWYCAHRPVVHRSTLGVDSVLVWPQYVAGKGLNGTVSAFLGEIARWCTGAGHLFLHTDGSCGGFLNWGFTKVFGLLASLGSFRRITWCVFIKGHSYNLCPWQSTSIHGNACHGPGPRPCRPSNMVCATSRGLLGSCVSRRMSRMFLSGWQRPAYMTSRGVYVDQDKQQVNIRDDRTKWTLALPLPMTLQPTPNASPAPPPWVGLAEVCVCQKRSLGQSASPSCMESHPGAPDIFSVVGPTSARRVGPGEGQKACSF